jgi:hypothetical protein
MKSIHVMFTSTIHLLILLDGEAPKEIYCPHSQKFEVDSFFSVIQADWKEPSFSDNVQVVNQTANVKSFDEKQVNRSSLFLGSKVALFWDWKSSHFLCCLRRCRMEIRAM